MIQSFNLTINTPKKEAFIDITQLIEAELAKTTMTEGLLTLFIPHTTAGITINENADPDVTHDMGYALDKMVPNYGVFRHLEGNSAAHVKASVFGASQSIIIRNGQLELGTWQGIYLCEFDGPRTRKVLGQWMGINAVENKM